MISFGVVMLEDTSKTFYSQMLRPLPDSGYVDGAMKVTGTKWADMVENGRDIKNAMTDFRFWISDVNSKGRPMFFSDNNGFDWQFINYYFHYALGENPFGFSSVNIGSLYKGMRMDMHQNFKHLRKTAHTHHPVDDAMGNAEALLAMKNQGLKL
jgi:hypothetical protein